MKKFLKLIIVFIIMIALICLVKKLDILDFPFFEISEERLTEYSDYYFKQLDLNEQKMYIRIDDAVKEKKQKVFLGSQETADLSENIMKVITAYFYDNPECYYISNQYVIKTRDFRFFKYSTVELDYTTKSASEINKKDIELEVAINNLLNSCIKDGMTIFEKEVAIHDALINSVTYYKYQDINAIPSIKHTAYGALVEKEAVCDGYAKAFKILLEKVGIESIIVSGITENVAHAWNVVKLYDNYYHVDVTSDKIEEASKKSVIHRYFNVTDKEITKTHVIDKTFKLPECNETKYDYYKTKDFYIAYEDNLYDNLQKIISKQRASGVLEIKVDSRYYSRNIINELYDLNFNNWRTSGKTSVEYNKIDDVYVFVK